MRIAAGSHSDAVSPRMDMVMNGADGTGEMNDVRVRGDVLDHD